MSKKELLLAVVFWFWISLIGGGLIYAIVRVSKRAAEDKAVDFSKVERIDTYDARGRVNASWSAPASPAGALTAFDRLPSSTPVAVDTCIPATYAWGAMVERMPEQSDIYLPANVFNDDARTVSHWRRLSFSVWVYGDGQLAARYFSKFWALSMKEDELDRRLRLFPAACEVPLP